MLRGFADADGSVSLASIHHGGANFSFGDGSVRPIVVRLIDDILRAMQVGAYGEPWLLLPAVPVPAGLAHPGNFTFEGLSDSIEELVTDEAMKKDLLRLTRQASEAARRGDADRQARFVAGIVNRISQGRGTSLPAVQADALILMARSL